MYPIIYTHLWLRNNNGEKNSFPGICMKQLREIIVQPHSYGKYDCIGEGWYLRLYDDKKNEKYIRSVTYTWMDYLNTYRPICYKEEKKDSQDKWLHLIVSDMISS